MNLPPSALVNVRTRNRLAFPVPRLSEDVLSEIFMNVVYGPMDSEMSEPSIEDDIRTIYRRVYSLLGVCSFWRDIVLTRGVLWSIIPVLPKPLPHDPQPFQLSLQRARGCPLHLAATTMLHDYLTAQRQILAILADYGASFRTVNLGGNLATIRGGIERLLQHDIRGLTELSIQLLDLPTDKLPENWEYIFPLNFPEKASFAKLTGGLQAFRVSGAPFHWDTMAFSTRLAEFRIDNLVLGHDTAIAPFLQVLSSASGLRDLKIISVITFRDSTPSHKIQPSPPVAFPNLQRLLLQDLYCNTLQSLILMIAPGSYSLTLSLDYMCLYTNIEYDDELDIRAECVSFGSLCGVLEHIPIHTLMIGRSREFSPSIWLTGSELCKLLETMPALKTLKMDNWKFGTDDWRCLKRSHDDRITPQDHPFPLLEGLCFSSARISSMKGLVEMVKSHPIQQMTLGATTLDVHPGETSIWRPLPESSPIVQQLKANVPTFRLIGSDHTPVDFFSDIYGWRLW